MGWDGGWVEFGMESVPKTRQEHDLKIKEIMKVLVENHPWIWPSEDSQMTDSFLK